MAWKPHILLQFLVSPYLVLDDYSCCITFFFFFFKSFLAHTTVLFFIMSVLPFFPWYVNQIFFMCLFKPSGAHCWLETLCVNSFVVASRSLLQVWTCMCTFHILPRISLMLPCEMINRNLPNSHEWVQEKSMPVGPFLFFFLSLFKFLF